MDTKQQRDNDEKYEKEVAREIKDKERRPKTHQKDNIEKMEKQ